MSKDLNISIKDIPTQLKRAAKKAQRYLGIACALFILGVYGFLILKISSASKADPPQDAVTAQLGASKRLKIDQQSVDKIQQLKDQNVNVQSLFETARDNPFSE